VNVAETERRGILFVMSAPSGTGKTTMALKLIEEMDGIELSVSYTTRPERDGERDGVDYHFVDDARFDAMIAEGAFLEWATVFGRRYGTGRDATESALHSGRDLMLEIDVQGARQIRESGVEAVSIFVIPPDYETLRSRLRNRASEDAPEVESRLAQGRSEVSEVRHYDYVVVNNGLDRAIADLRSIVIAERRRFERCRREAETIIATFPA